MSSNFLTSDDSCGNLFARGFMSTASMMRPRICERIRRMLEECDLPEGFIIINSLGGGTGSGLTAALLNTLRIYYKNLVQLQVTLFPTPQVNYTVLVCLFFYITPSIYCFTSRVNLCLTIFIIFLYL